MNFKQYYINGDLRLLGSRNLYGMWNNLMYTIHIYVNFCITLYYTKDKRSAVRFRKAIRKQQK